MKELFFFCRGAAGSDDTLVYHESPRKDNQEEFFVFFQSVDGSVDDRLRELYREALSLSRLGHPKHYCVELVNRFNELIGTDDIERFEGDYRIVVGIRRGVEFYLFRSANTVVKCWREDGGLNVGDASSMNPEVIMLSEADKQTDLFEKKLEDIFLLERFTLDEGAHTLVVLPNVEFYERNRERLMDTIFFPDFDPSKLVNVTLEWLELSFCGVHWNLPGMESRRNTHTEKRKTSRLSLPLVVGIVTAIVAFAVFFFPMNRRGEKQEKHEDRALLLAEDAGKEDIGAVETEGNEGEEAKGVGVEEVREKKLSLELLWNEKFTRPVTSSPLAFEDRVIFGCRDGFLYCYDADGRLLWKYNSHSGIGASPVLSGNSIFCANYSGKVFALDRETGEERWIFNAGEKIVSSPRVHGDLVLTGTVRGKFFALDRDDGRLRWEKKLGLGIWANSYAGSNFIIAATMDGSLVKLKYNGDIIWKVKLGKGILSSPLCLEDMNRVIFGCKDGYIYCYSISDGKLLWRFNASGEVNGAPAYSDGTVVIGSRNGILYALDTSGKLKWKRNLSQPVLSRPLLLDKKVFVTNYASSLYALDVESGKVLKRFKTSSPIYSSCGFYGDKIFFGSNGGTFYALRLYD